MGAQRTDGVIFQSAVSLCEIFANFLQTSSWLLISKYFRQQHIARAVDQYQQYAHNSPVCNETDIRLTYCRFCQNNDNKLALLWGEAQKKIAYSYLKVT